MAFSALGLQEYLNGFPGDRAAMQTMDETVAPFARYLCFQPLDRMALVRGCPRLLERATATGSDRVRCRAPLTK